MLEPSVELNIFDQVHLSPLEKPVELEEPLAQKVERR